MNLNTPEIDKIIRERSLYLCQECGKCSASCPRWTAGRDYSPRLLAEKMIDHREDSAYIKRVVWECLTCGQCEQRCPAGVQFNQFILEMRSALICDGALAGCLAHDGAIHAWMRMMTSEGLEQRRLDWAGPDLKVAASGKVAFFAGCAPYFDIFFSDLQVNTVAIAQDSLKLLNALDIEPVLLGSERCCGHDLLWTGDREGFEALSRLNYREFKAAGVEEIVVSCPECYQTLSRNMPGAVPEFDLKVTPLLDLVARAAGEGSLSFKPFKKKVTFQDPCRLARMNDLAAVPRELMSRIEGLELIDMDHRGQGTICCGNNGFVSCDAFSKQIQVKRLSEARATGADLLVTACPKCQIHLSCAMRDPLCSGDARMEIRDLTGLLADHLT